MKLIRLSSSIYCVKIILLPWKRFKYFRYGFSSLYDYIWDLPEKQWDWCHKLFKFKRTNYMFSSLNYPPPPLKPNSLFHPFLPCFYALLEGFLLKVPQLHHYSLLSVLHELGEKKKSTWSKISWIERFFHSSNVLLGQDLLHAQGIVSKCIKSTMICPDNSCIWKKMQWLQ